MITLNLLPQMVYRLLAYKIESVLGYSLTTPMSITVSVTQRCNSKCKTCNIWADKQRRSELSVDEYEKIFKSIGRSVFIYTLSGGEPFLRKDVVEIVRLMKYFAKPSIILIPSNAILTGRITAATKQILEITAPDTILIVNLSLDGIGEEHDEIRGISGNYDNFRDTLFALQELKKSYVNCFEIGVHSVVSRFNVEKIFSLFEYVQEYLHPDSYICEIAENREELLNMDEDITPDIELYEKSIRPLQHELRKSLLHNNGVTGMIQAFRLKYYDYVITEMREKRRLFPCYAGRVSAQISPWGDVWPCCILASKADMGYLGDFKFNFKDLWRSKRATKIRDQVHKGDCYCPMANVHYTNMVLSPSAMIEVIKNYISVRIGRSS